MTEGGDYLRGYRHAVQDLVSDVTGLVADYSDPNHDFIAYMPFMATLDQILLEKYGIGEDR